MTHHVYTKICGITHLDDALLAASLGADFLGFIFYDKSPRYIHPKNAGEIITQVKSNFPHVQMVGVAVNPSAEDMEEIITADHIDILQLAGEETPEFCQACPLPVWKTIHIKDTFSLVRIKQYSFLPALILDTFVPGMYGGTGKTFPLELALEAKKYTSNLVISGGINEENVQEIIEQTEPWGIDLSSSVEAKPGKKDPAKLTSFMNHLKTLSPVV